MKLKDFLLKEMSLPNVDNEEQATKQIEQAYQYSMKGPWNADIYGGLQASLQWLMKQSNLGTSPSLNNLKTKALAAKKKLNTLRTTQSTAQPQMTTTKGEAWGQNPIS